MDLERKCEQKVHDDGTESEIRKTSSKLKVVQDGIATTYTFANDKMAIDTRGNAHKDGDWVVDIGAGAEIKQAEKKWKATGIIDVRGNDVGGSKLNFSVSNFCSS